MKSFFTGVLVIGLFLVGQTVFLTMTLQPIAKALDVSVSVGVSPAQTPTSTPSLIPTGGISPTASPSAQAATILGFSPRVWAAIGAGLVALLAAWFLTRPLKAP